MAYTTPQAIIAGASNLIKAQDPSYEDAGGSYEFEPRSEEIKSWDAVPDDEKDRRFTVDKLTRGRPTMFGAVAEIDYEGTFDVTIMHQVSDDENDGIMRRDADLHQICMALEKKANWATYLTAVWLVRYNGQSIRRTSKEFWQSILNFRITYTLQAV